MYSRCMGFFFFARVFLWQFKTMTKWGQCGRFLRVCISSPYQFMEKRRWTSKINSTLSSTWNTTHSYSSFMCMYRMPFMLHVKVIYIYIYALMKGHICLCTQEVITGNGALTIPWKRAAKRVKITHVISLLLLSFSLMMYFFLWLCIFLHHSSSYQNDSLLPLLVRRREVCHVVIQLEQSHCLFGPARSH